MERKGQLDQALKLYQQALKETNGLSGEELANELLSIHDAIGEIYRSQGDLSQACDQWKKAVDVATRQFGEDSAELNSFRESLAWACLDQQDFDEAVSHADKSLQSSIKNFGEDSFETTSSLLLLGHIYTQKGDNTKALDFYEKTLKILNKDPKGHADQLSYTNMLIAKIYWGKRDTQKATEYFNKSAQALQDAFGDNHQKLGKCYKSWGKLLRKNILSMDEAKTVFKKSLDIYKKAKTTDQAALADLYSYLGEIEYYEDNFDESLKWYKEFVGVCSQGKIDPELCEEVYSFMGAIYSKQENVADSIKYYEKAVESCQEVSADHSNLDYHYRNLGGAYEKGGKLEQAREIYQKDLDLAVKRHGKEDETTQRSAGLVSDILKKMNKHKEADNILRDYGKGK